MPTLPIYIAYNCLHCLHCLHWLTLHPLQCIFHLGDSPLKKTTDKLYALFPRGKKGRGAKSKRQRFICNSPTLIWTTSLSTLDVSPFRWTRLDQQHGLHIFIDILIFDWAGAAKSGQEWIQISQIEQQGLTNQLWPLETCFHSLFPHNFIITLSWIYNLWRSPIKYKIECCSW